jgi:hypothetical protein
MSAIRRRETSPHVSNAQIADAPGPSGEPANRAEAVIRSLLKSPSCREGNMAAGSRFVAASEGGHFESINWMH